VTTATADGSREATAVALDALRFPRARVLLAEDDDEFRAVVACALRKNGYEVIEAKDGTELVDLLTDALLTGRIDTEYDLVVTDIRMPGYTGLEVLHGVCQTDSAPPVVVITAFGDEQTHRLARELGSMGVLDKPFDMDDLRMAVLNTLTRHDRLETPDGA
jgi:DNA-binding response OmpR family regulator